jgi:hypothetical protein
LTFEYDPTVERGVRLSRLIDELTQANTTEAAELADVAAAIRGHDRFLVTTHENPDGDALGSLLAMALALRELGKDAEMYLFGEVPIPKEYEFMEFAGILRGPNPARATGSSSRSTLRTNGASGPERAAREGAVRDRHRPPSRQHALRRREPIVADRVVDRRDPPRRLRRSWASS